MIKGHPATRARGALLQTIKERGSATISELSRLLKVSGEAVRQQLAKLSTEGWIEESIERAERVGRPSRRFRLTPSGEHLFPKAYDQLTVELIDRLTDKGGEGLLRELLASMADSRVQAWAPRLAGMSVEERMEALKGIYLDEDPFISTERHKGELRLVERNCPFLSVASRRPALCSLTVSTLSRLLGHSVERVESFQGGHGRCVFQVRRDQPVDGSFRFEFETPKNGSSCASDPGGKHA